MQVTRALCLGLFALATAGCAAAHPIAPMDTGIIRFRAPAFDEALLRQSGVVVLPLASASPSSSADVGVASRLGRRVAIALREQGVASIVLSPAEARERLVEAGLSADIPWSDELLAPETLAAVAHATRCRFVLHASAGTGSSVDEATLHGTGSLVGTPYTSRKPHVSRVVTTDIEGHLWDAVTGDLVWAGHGGGAALTLAPHYGNTNHTDSLAIDGFAARFGRDPAGQPEPQTVAHLHAKDHAQAADVIATNREIAGFLVFSEPVVYVLLYLLLAGIAAL